MLHVDTPSDEIPVPLTISTTGRTSASLFASTNLQWVGLPCLLLLAWQASRRDRRLALAVILLSIGLATAGCGGDRKSTRLNSSHQIISYAVFCLKTKKDVQHA